MLWVVREIPCHPSRLSAIVTLDLVCHQIVVQTASHHILHPQKSSEEAGIADFGVSEKRTPASPVPCFGSPCAPFLNALRRVMRRLFLIQQLHNTTGLRGAIAECDIFVTKDQIL